MRKAAGKRGRAATGADIVEKAPTQGHWDRFGAADGSPDMARLRLFCRLRGIEIPYRHAQEPGRRAAGFAEALRRAASSERSQFMVLVSDLEGVLDDPEPCLRAVSLARQRHHQVFVVAPFGPSFIPTVLTPVGDKVAEVLGDEERRRLDHARHELVRHGVHVLVAGPSDTPDSLARRMVRTRPLRSRA
jgi:hypothetical protein